MAHKYKFLYKPEHPNSNSQGYILAHRYIMAQHIGRPLRKDEDVHHINGDKTDNRIENLQLLLKSEHTILTHGGKGEIKKDFNGRFCNLCKTRNPIIIKTTKRAYWMNDINGFLCPYCYMMVRGFIKRLNRL